MNLRWSILSVILMTFLGLVIVLTISLQGILVPHFRQEENRASEVNVQRVLGFMDNEWISLGETIASWAISNENYAIAQRAPTLTVPAFMNEPILQGLNINMLLVLNQQGDVVYSYVTSGEDEQVYDIPKELIDRITSGSNLLQTPEGNHFSAGLLSTSQGPLLVISAPLRKSNGAGPSGGTLLAGRFLDAEELNRIAGVVRYPLNLIAYDQDNMDPGYRAAKSALTGNQAIVTFPTRDTQLSGYTLLRDFDGNPAYILQVDQGRSIFRSSQIVLFYLYAVMILGMLLFSIITYMAVDRLATGRIRLLGKEVTQIGISRDLTARVTISRRDELSRVGEEINGMLANLEQLSHRLVEIQEDERRSIALELHDEVGQLLTGLKLQIESPLKDVSRNVYPSLDQARCLVDDLIQKVRNLSLDLRPTMLDDLGLLPALVWHFDRFTTLSGIRVNFTQNGVSDRRFSPEIESTTYRIAQEALTNVARHSGAQEVFVTISYLVEVLTIQIEDRGCGFSVQEQLENGITRGLHGMEERVNLVGGALTIDSVPGWGTSIMAEIPAKALPEEGSEHDYVTFSR